MDQLETWVVRGRIATAIKNVRESLARLAVDSQELKSAMAEAEQLGIDIDSQSRAIAAPEPVR